MKYRIAIQTLFCAALWTIGFGQAQEPEPKCLIQNGNMNGDNILDLSDVIHVLSFLYIGGSEPTPLFVADVQCVTTLNEELAVAKTDLAQGQAALVEAQAEASAAKAALSECQGALAVRDADIAGYQETIAERDTELATTKLALTQAQMSLTACSSNLEATRTERDAANQQLAGATASLQTCGSDLAAKTTDLATCQASVGKRGLPATGQAKCYVNGTMGGETDCASTDYPGQDGFYQAGCPSEARFVDHGDGTVTDTCTGLMWQRYTADVNGDGLFGNEDQVNWQDALKYCESLSFAGNDDWRLPNVRELQSIVDYGCWNPLIAPVFEPAPGTVVGSCWSSSSLVAPHLPVYAWYVRFYDGDVVGLNDKGAPMYVRAVRGGIPVHPGCTDPSAQNYDPEANFEDGSCRYPCTDNCPEIPGFTFLGNNEQKYAEYSHDQTEIVFVYMPGGTFNMGSPEDEEGRSTQEGPIHPVTLSSFLIAKHELTQVHWESVIGSNPSAFRGANRPVEQVSWDECLAFCTATGLRFPTEAQWEYACRAGTQGPYAGSGVIDEMGWYSSNSGSRTHDVGGKQPNAFGFFDMHGNVFEWCEDVYDHLFYTKPEAVGPDPVCTSGDHRVFRGGSWANDARICRSAFRYGSNPSSLAEYLGFRPAFFPLP